MLFYHPAPFIPWIQESTLHKLLHILPLRHLSAPSSNSQPRIMTSYTLLQHSSLFNTPNILQPQKETHYRCSQASPRSAYHSNINPKPLIQTPQYHLRRSIHPPHLLLVRIQPLLPPRPHTPRRNIRHEALHTRPTTPRCLQLKFLKCAFLNPWDEWCRVIK